ncbi:uncharacterized protein BDZ99DRAFT_572834 [Mytilinidion resinicola]|uniref:Cytochrome P450 n=1 Tax=Mytilinidion resinicola TaxID=574789 RepID=A0A6A6YGL7_9PEZI|nr:uncharacterized protein BDZ99DRAFT_572834 [Mytilinidion resinicola]KAF2807956.1 hypothetical protein BDZ99DRAFT_572834 [Mytilinidion resinicola]
MSSQKYEPPQSPPPGYIQAPPAAYHDPNYSGSPAPQQGYYQSPPPGNADYYGGQPQYGPPQGPYGPQYGQQYPPPQGMYYQQGPPGGYYDDRGRGHKFWPQPDEFLHEHFLLPENHPLHPVRGAWRPFEFGPRNCLGQTLSMLDLRVTLLMVVGSGNS